MRSWIADGRPVRKPHPSRETAFTFTKTDDPRTALEPLASVARIAGSAAIAEPDPGELTFVVIDVIVTDEAAHDIAGLDERREEPAVERWTAHGLILGAAALLEIPDFVVLGQRDVEERERRQ